MSRAFVGAFCFWLLLAFVTWNVVFDRQVAVSAVAFTRELTRVEQRGAPVVSIDSGFSPDVRAAAARASVWAAGILVLGAVVSLTAARSLGARPPAPSR